MKIRGNHQKYLIGRSIVFGRKKITKLKTKQRIYPAIKSLVKIFGALKFRSIVVWLFLRFITPLICGRSWSLGLKSKTGLMLKSFWFTTPSNNCFLLFSLCQDSVTEDSIS